MHVLRRIQKLFEAVFRVAESQFPLHQFSKDQQEEILRDPQNYGFGSAVKLLGGLLKALHANAENINLAGLVKVLHGDKEYSDDGKAKEFKKFGFSPRWRRISNPTGFTLSDSDTFIYQSPSGIFEQRVTVKELKEKADKQK